MTENIQNEEELTTIAEEELSGIDASAEAEETADTENAPPEEAYTDYSEIANCDLEELKREFRELSSLTDITELKNPLRYAALRDLGLTPAEAYLATNKRDREDNRSHLTSRVPRRAASESRFMTDGELRLCRELFEDLSDSEIRKLYKKVTK